MPTITYDKFDGGLDVRQLATTADANRLRQLENAFVTTGKTIRKRPGLKKVGDIQAGTFGLFSGLGKIWTFSTFETEHLNLPELLSHGKLDDPTQTGIKRIVQVEVFQGYLYVVCQYNDGSYKHHYLDGKTPTYIEDANCPHTPQVIKNSGKIFAIDDEVVRFTATNDARDWTLEEDAGFLAVSLQQSTSNMPTALGQFEASLVVFFEDSAQVWTIDPDPKNHRLTQNVPIGTVYSYGHANMSADIFFLSPAGFRSVSVQSYTTSLMDTDIGSPIDELMRKRMRAGDMDPRMVYYRGGGQLICFIGAEAYVYSYSRSAKISAWSKWVFPFAIDQVTEHKTKLYVRNGNEVFVFDEMQYTDNGTTIPVLAQLPYLDQRKPSQLKRYQAVDVAAVGDFDISFLYDPANPDAETPVTRMSGDTRPLPAIPVEVGATNLSIKVAHNSPSEFELAGISLLFQIHGNYNT